MMGGEMLGEAPKIHLKAFPCWTGCVGDWLQLNNFRFLLVNLYCTNTCTNHEFSMPC